MTCPRCSKENDNANKFCGRCGLDFTQYNPTKPSASTEEVVYCYKHKKEPTLLSCGRCERPICTKCAKMGPAGPRCPDCAKHNVAVRPGAYLFNFQQNIKGFFTGVGRQGFYGYYLLFLIGSSLFTGFRYGCAGPRRERAPIQSQTEYQSPEEEDANAPIDENAPE